MEINYSSSNSSAKTRLICHQNPEAGSESCSPTTDGAVFEHILPSFEMHNYMFNRTILDTENLSEIQAHQPPSYVQQSLTSPNPPEPIDNNRFVDPTQNPDLLVLNNLSSLQKLDLPIEISFVLSEGPLGPDELTCTPKSPFQDYKPGDLVTGYIIIENVSKQSIPFEMFLVSLEGTLTTRSFAAGTDTTPLHRKTFLKMYDLCACFHQGKIDAGLFADRCGDFCPASGGIYGLPNDQCLRPGMKRKKRFVFRIPEFLLDTTCEHQSPEHLQLPPSYGIDIESFNGRAKDIEIDNLLGYGRLNNEPCSPLRVPDFSDLGQSVSYSINATMIGRKSDSYKRFYTTQTTHDYDFIILQDIQRFFRISTANNYSLPILPTYDSTWYFKSSVTTDQQIQQLQKLCGDTLERLKLKNELIASGVKDPNILNDILNYEFSTYKKSQQSEPSGSLDHALLSCGNQHKSEATGTIQNFTAATINKSLFSKYEGEFVIELSTSKKNSINAIFPKKFTHRPEPENIEPELTRNSITSLKASNCSTKSTKRSDSLIERRARTSVTSISNSSSQLQSPSSSLPSLVEKSSDKITLDLTFNPRNGSKPPESITIKPTLEALNLQSEQDIPLSIDNDFFLESSSIETVYGKMTKIKQAMTKNLVNLKIQARKNDLGIPKTLCNDLTALTKLILTKRVFSLFKKIENKDIIWEKDSSGVYHSCLEIDLLINEKFNNKHHIIPSFQTCLLSRFYAVRFEFSCSKSKFKDGTAFATLPMNVV